MRQHRIYSVCRGCEQFFEGKHTKRIACLMRETHNVIHDVPLSIELFENWDIPFGCKKQVTYNKIQKLDKI